MQDTLQFPCVSPPMEKFFLSEKLAHSHHE
jgi:hypothetical protein